MLEPSGMTCSPLIAFPSNHVPLQREIAPLLTSIRVKSDLAVVWARKKADDCEDRVYRTAVDGHELGICGADRTRQCPPSPKRGLTVDTSHLSSAEDVA